jgi:hypothetical protein
MNRARHPRVPHIGTLLLIALCACASKEIRITDHEVFGEWPPPGGVIALRGCEGRIEGTHIHCFVGAMLYSDWTPVGDRRRRYKLEGPYEDHTHVILVKHRAGPDVDCGTSYHARPASPERGSTSWEVRVGDEAVVTRYLVTHEPPLDTVDIGGKGYDLAQGRLFLIDLTADPPEVEQQLDEGFFIAWLIYGTPVVGSAIAIERKAEGPTPYALLASPEALAKVLDETRNQDPEVEDWLDL